MHDINFAGPFAEALDMTISYFKFPSDGKFGKEQVKHIQGVLQINMADQFRPVYDQLEKEAKKNKLPATKWQVVGDSVRRYVLGNYQRDVIPTYIKKSIEKLADKRWASYFMQTMVVKHNHLTVTRVRASERKKGALLMDLEGKLLTDMADPHPPEFFETITVPLAGDVQAPPPPPAAPAAPAAARLPVEAAPARTVHILRISGVSNAGLDLDPNTPEDIRKRRSGVNMRRLRADVEDSDSESDDSDDVHHGNKKKDNKGGKVRRKTSKGKK